MVDDAGLDSMSIKRKYIRVERMANVRSSCQFQLKLSKVLQSILALNKFDDL